MYGKDHIKIAGCYQAVALAHYDIDDIMKAIEYQQKCVAILKFVIILTFLIVSQRYFRI